MSILAVITFLLPGDSRTVRIPRPFANGSRDKRLHWSGHAPQYSRFGPRMSNRRGDLHHGSDPSIIVVAGSASSLAGRGSDYFRIRRASTCTSVNNSPDGSS